VEAAAAPSRRGVVCHFEKCRIEKIITKLTERFFYPEKNRIFANNKNCSINKIKNLCIKRLAYQLIMIPWLKRAK
jgi:hypothetical protein